MKDFLPKEFQFAHDFSVYLHDLIAHIIIYGESKSLFNIQFDIHSKEHASVLETVRDEQLWEWLEQNQYSDVIIEMLLKRLYPALLSDFCHFVFEALSCSRRAKLTVTYALLRKPLRENLFYLEWLLADPGGMLKTFYEKTPRELALNQIAARDQAIEIIRKAISRLPNSSLYDPEFMYDLRFNKAASFGFEQLWNKALHLVTTNKHLETERQNFNFVFSDDESRWSQWDHIYKLLPYLLFYALDICDALMFFILREPYPGYTEVVYRRSLGFVIWSFENHKLHPNNEEANLEFPGLTEVKINCPWCKKEIPPEEAQVRNLFDKEKIKCPICNHIISISDIVATT